MFYEIKTIDGVKTKVPLTNSSGVVAGGNPIGTIISTYKKIKPANYLYCDGSTFDPEIYPGLYLYLGTNVLPDYRECAMVGAEKNTTNVFDSTETDPSTGLPGTQSHDVYTEGEFKDDQLQGHWHGDGTTSQTNGASTSGQGFLNVTGNGWTTKVNVATKDVTSNGTNGTPRIGSTTHGKQKAVFYYIKAVDGVDITDEDAFLEEVKDFVEAGQSYSTSEQRTGGTWIDGKPIYRKTYYSATNWANGAIVDTVPNVAMVITIKQIASDGSSYREFYTDTSNGIGLGYFLATGQIRAYRSGSFATTKPSLIIFEYTKTTD